MLRKPHARYAWHVVVCFQALVMCSGRVAFAQPCTVGGVPVTDSTPCSVDNAGNPVAAIPGACKTPGCEAGQCVAQHIPVTDSTPCLVDNAGNPVTPIPGACKTRGCEAGQCVREHINVTDSTACSVDNAGNAVTAIPGACTTPGCEAGTCVAQHVPKTDSTPCTVDANGNPVTPAPGCQPGCEAGACTATHTCKVPICRSPGFWGTHACPENSSLVSSCENAMSKNITQAVINAAGGCFVVCGEVIKNTILANADSTVEAICVSPAGNQRLQLIRQLTAMALNCIISGLKSDCSGDPAGLGKLFSHCNSVCLGTGTTSIRDCI